MGEMEVDRAELTVKGINAEIDAARAETRL